MKKGQLPNLKLKKKIYNLVQKGKTYTQILKLIDGLKTRQNVHYHYTSYLKILESDKK